MCLGSALAEASDAREDVVCGLGPREGLGVEVAHVDEPADVLLELNHAEVRSSFDHLLGEMSKPALDLVEPRGIGRREVDVEPRVPQSRGGSCLCLWVIETRTEKRAEARCELGQAAARAETLPPGQDLGVLWPLRRPLKQRAKRDHSFSSHPTLDLGNEQPARALIGISKVT